MILPTKVALSPAVDYPQIEPPNTYNMLSTLNRSLLSTTVRIGGKRAPLVNNIISSRCLSSAATTEDAPVDPMEVFDSIDTNGDGVLSKDEFRVAVEKMHYVSSF